MHARLLTFTGIKDIEPGVPFVRNQALPVLNAQPGYRGLSISGDRAAMVIGMLSMWESEADRDASESALGILRHDGLELLGGELVIEHFELVVQDVIRPTTAGSSLMVIRATMDPRLVNDNVTFFKSVTLGEIQAQPGFCGLRYLLDRDTGDIMVGIVWESRMTMAAAAELLPARRARGESMGIRSGTVSFREVLLTDKL